MRLDLDASFAVHSTCSLLSLRFFDVKASVFPYFANGSCQIQTYLLLEAYIKVTNDLVIFHNVLLWVFSVVTCSDFADWTIDRHHHRSDSCKRKLLYLDTLESRSIHDTDTLSLHGSSAQCGLLVCWAYGSPSGLKGKQMICISGRILSRLLGWPMLMYGR